MFNIESDKVRCDAIAIYNDLMHRQVYDLANTEESTEAQMIAIASHKTTTDVHAVKIRGPKRKKTTCETSQKQPEVSRQQGSQPKKPRKPCYKCGGHHARRDPFRPKTNTATIAKRKDTTLPFAIRSNVKTMT